MSKDVCMYDITNINDSSLKHRVSKPPLKKNVKYLSQKTVNMMAVDIRLKKEITKTINKLKKSTAEIDSEIVRYQTRRVPDAKYQLTKRKNMCKKLEAINEEFLKNMNILENQINDVKENKRIIETELSHTFDQELNDCENKYRSLLYETIDKYEVELTELEKMPPKDELEKEINDARQKIIDLLEELDDVKMKNEESVKLEKGQKRSDFEKFQNDSNRLLDELKHKGEDYIIERNQLLESQANLLDDIKKLNENMRLEEIAVDNLQKESDELNDTTITLSNQNDQLLKTIERQELELKSLQALANTHNMRCDEEYNKMELELAKRKKLENSIDELKGLIRCFAYMDSTKFNNFTIDYVENVILDENDEIYPFNRIIPSNALSLSQLIFREYKAYHDFCLNQNSDFSLLTVSNNNWFEFRSQFIDFLSHEFSTNYDISLQNVFLSDEKISKDLIKQNQSGDNNTDSTVQLSNYDPHGEKDSSCINIKFEGKNLVMNTKSISLEEYKYSFAQNQIDYDFRHGINLFTFRFIKKNDPHSQTNFHLVNFEDLELLYNLLHYFSLYKPKDSTSHVGHVINRLITQVKSCFIFNFDSIDDIQHNSPGIDSDNQVDDRTETKVLKLDKDNAKSENDAAIAAEAGNDNQLVSHRESTSSVSGKDKLNELTHKLLEISTKIGQIPNPQNRKDSQRS